MMHKIKILAKAALITLALTLLYIGTAISWVVAACILMPLSLILGIGRAKETWEFLRDELLDFCPTPKKFFESAKEFWGNALCALKNKKRGNK